MVELNGFGFPFPCNNCHGIPQHDFPTDKTAMTNGRNFSLKAYANAVIYIVCCICTAGGAKLVLKQLAGLKKCIIWLQFNNLRRLRLFWGLPCREFIPAHKMCFDSYIFMSWLLFQPQQCLITLPV